MNKIQGRLSVPLFYFQTCAYIFGMKKLLLVTSIIFMALTAVNAQMVVNCASGRYDTEVFSSVNITSNITYGSNLSSSGLNTQLTMDIYEPAGDTAAMRPLIVWAHGGSFVTGTKLDPDITSLCNHFAKRGYVCVSINYRLGIPIPPSQTGATQAVYRAVQDMKAAIRYMRKDAATTNLYRIDPNFIVAGGSSAGAFMSLHLAYLDEVSEIPTSIDTIALGNLEGNSGNPGYPSSINAVVNLCGAIGNKTWLHATDEPLCSMHGTNDNTVPYSTATIYLYGVYPLMVVDGSYAINDYANQIGLSNVMYTYFGADHVPYLASTAYMDTTVRFVSNFLYQQIGCSPTDPNPLPNTFQSTTGLYNDLSNQHFSVYPQPATDQLMIASASVVDYTELLDLTGRVLLYEEGTNEKEVVLHLGGLPAGTYFVRIYTETGNFVKKVLKGN